MSPIANPPGRAPRENRRRPTFTWIDAAIAGEAARQRVAHRLTLTDAFQVAAALAGGAGALLTNDLTLKRVTALPILVLDELEL